jgi:hypothetical protein
MVQPGVVWFDAREARSDTGPWDFTLDAFPGSADLIAASDSHSIVIRRNLNTDQMVSFAPIDVAAEGTPMTPFDVNVTGTAASEHLMTGVWLTTAGAKAWFVGLPAYDGLDLLLDQTRNDAVVTEFVSATKRWIDNEASASISLGFDAAPPQIDPSWLVDPSMPYDGVFALSHSGSLNGEYIVVTNGASVQRWSPVPLPGIAPTGTSMRSKHASRLPFSQLAAGHHLAR